MRELIRAAFYLVVAPACAYAMLAGTLAVRSAYQRSLALVLACVGFVAYVMRRAP